MEAVARLTETLGNGLLAASRGKLFVIIPTSWKPQLPVEIVVTQLNSEGCTVELKPVEEGGAKGYKAAGKMDRWQYEVNRSCPIPFGRTFSELTLKLNGNIEVKTTDPLKQAVKRGPKKNKALTRVDKAIETVLKMPTPVQPVDPGTLGQLVRSINTLKGQLGDEMTLKVTSNGLLTATLEYS